MYAILKKFDEDYPTLFEVPEPVKDKTVKDYRKKNIL